MRKFYPSREHKLVAGVCGGLAKKFGISPLLVRFACVALIAFGGLPIVAVFAFSLVEIGS